MQALNFLVCSERAGSNLICAMMNAHSQVYAPMPLHLGMEFWDRIYRYGSLSRPESWEMLVKHVVHTCDNMPMRLDVEITTEEVMDRVAPGNFKDLFVYIYTKGMEAAGKRVLFLKDNHIHRQFHYLLRYWPDAKLVVQVRDPRDYAVSCRNVSKQYMHYGSLSNAIRVWREDQERALNALFTLPPTQVFAQTYEDLVDDPRRVLTSLCNFIGVEFEEQMLRFHETQSAKAAAQNLPSYWGNLGKPLIANNVAKYRQRLSRFEIREIEAQLAGVMERFGYVPDFPHESTLEKLGQQLYRLGVAPIERLQEALYRRGLSSWKPVALQRLYDEERATMDTRVRYPYR